MATRQLKCFYLRVLVAGKPFYRKGGRIHAVHAHSLTEAREGLRSSGFSKMRAVFLDENAACQTAHTDFCEHLLLWHSSDVIHMDPPPPAMPADYPDSFSQTPEISPARERLREKMMHDQHLD